MMDKSGKPEGGKWSFDMDNRESFGKITEIPNEIIEFDGRKRDELVESGIKYISRGFRGHYGSCNKEDFIYPINRKESLEWLDNFLKYKFKDFGKYEDAFSLKIKIGYHSVLSPLLNVGLITTFDVIRKIKEKSDKNIPLSSEEGFIRQIIGWREYCYLIYDKFNANLIKTAYITQNKGKIPACFWERKTGMVYIDNILENINKSGYCHHTERLMCIGCFMIFIGIDADEILKWFQIMFIDAQDVFMMPNVYGMLLYGKIIGETRMLTRPYFCSSNYLLKMSDFKTINNNIKLGTEEYKWTEIVDCLYYNHVNKYKEVLGKIYSTASAVKVWTNKSETEQKKIKLVSKKYIQSLYR
jgi:deoxyribodipyrimidine photolyase-related protein